MTDVQKSLTYDAVFLVPMIIIAVLTDGTFHAIALLLIVTTLLKVPYDVCEARRSSSEHLTDTLAPSDQLGDNEH